MKTPIENKIYASLISECEHLEFNDKYHGHGHHLAQKLTTLVSIGILSKQKKIIFDALTKEPQTVKEIFQKTGIPSKNISSQLKQMYDNTSLIHFKMKNARIKLWYK